MFKLRTNWYRRAANDGGFVSHNDIEDRHHQQMMQMLNIAPRPNGPDFQITEKPYSNQIIISAWMNGQAVGGCCLQKTSQGMMVHSLYTDPRYRRQGVGQKVLEYVKSKYGKLVASIENDNQTSSNLFGRSGFSPTQYDPLKELGIGVPAAYTNYQNF